AGIELTHASGGSITNNKMTGGQTSLDMQNADNLTVSGNVAHSATVYGFYIANAATGDNVHDNDFRTTSNFNLKDCKGESSTVVSVGSGNQFDSNEGNTSSPAALCAGRPPG